MSENSQDRPLDWWKYYILLMQKRRLPYIDYYLGNQKILDVGCGEGKMLERYSNWQGIDINSDLVNKCQQRNLPASVMSAFAMDYADNTFDGIHSAMLIEHFYPADAFNFLKEAARVVRKHGIILLTTPSVKRIWNTFSHIRPYPPAALKKILTIATEGYIAKSSLPLQLLAAHATTSSLLDPIWQRSDPDGWVIVLCKNS